MPIFKSRHTNSNSMGKEGKEDLTLQRDCIFNFPVRIFHQHFHCYFSREKENKKKKEKEKKRGNKSWYEELHQVTLPAHLVTVSYFFLPLLYSDMS